MKKSLVAAFIATTLVFGGGSVALAAGPVKDKAACASAKVAHKAAVTKVDKKATAKVVAKVCKVKKSK